LRGCVGTYLPTKESIAEEIIQNAIAAATEDYRFGQIKKEELPFLSYTVYILNPPELIKDIKELNPKKYGIIIRTADPPAKSALLLPDLEGVNTTEEQIEIVCQKGDINPAKDKLIIFRFTVEKHEEK
jgi:AMMECR1 domain-containing protein